VVTVSLSGKKAALLPERALTVARWAAVLVGIVAALPATDRADGRVSRGAMIVVFVAAWRTLRPTRGKSAQGAHGALVGLGVELVAIAVAVGLSGTWQGPFTSSFVIAVGAAGLLAGVVGVVGCVLIGALVVEATAALVSGPLGPPRRATEVCMLAAIAGFAAALAVDRLREAESARDVTASELVRLTQTNDLIVALTSLTRSGDVLRDADTIAEQAIERLDDLLAPSACALLLREDAANEWAVAAMRPMSSSRPNRFADSILSPELVEIQSAREALTSGGLLDESARVRIRGPLRARGELLGMVLLEHRDPTHFNTANLEQLDEILTVLALNLDNSRWFRRLRSLGAEDERAKVARDLHDRVGASVAYLAFGLERQLSQRPADDDLSQLHTHARATVRELRDTLWQLRAAIDEGHTLSDVVPEMLERFTARTGVEVGFVADPPDGRRAPVIELELLRLLQEALTNVERHSGATAVKVRWAIRPDAATLTIADNGSGFDVSAVRRLDAYGLLGMRERADSIGGVLAIRSSPGAGTEIDVVVPRVPAVTVAR
jgi:signal transduction histidine kinase